MTPGNQMLLALGSVLLVSMILAITGYRRALSSESLLVSFFWGDRQLRAGDTAHLLLSTSFSLNGLLYQTWLGYQIGPAAVLIQAVWCLSYILLSKKAQAISALSQSGTLHGVIGSRFGRRAELVAAWASVIGFAILIGWELAVFTSLFALVSAGSVSKTYQLVVTLAAATIVAAYTILGGLRGNVRANRVQNWLAGGGFIAAVAFAMSAIGTPLTGGEHSAFVGWSTFSLLVTSLGIGGLITNLVFSVSWQFVDMSAWQGIAATAPKEGESKRALWWSALWVFLFPGVFGTWAGMFLRGIPNLTSDNIVAVLVQRIAEYPALGLFVIAGLMAAMLSTLDGLLLATAQAYSWDIKARALVERTLRFWSAAKKPEVGPALNTSATSVAGSSDAQSTGVSQDFDEIRAIEKRLLSGSRRVIGATAILGALFVLLLHVQTNVGLFDLVYVVVISQMTLLPVVLAVLYGGKLFRGSGAASIGIGWAAGVLVAFLTLGRSPELQAWSPFIALLVSFVVLLVPRTWFSRA